VGCPIRRSLDQSPFPAPQSLSQGITSFIASCCQGIHQTPFSRLIRSRDGQGSRRRPRSHPRRGRPFARVPASVPPAQSCAGPGSGSHTFSRSPPGSDGEHSVSVLDLDTDTALGPASRRTPAPPHSEEPAVLMLLFLHDVNTSSNRTAQPRRAERSGRGSWWSLSGSNRRPPACKAGALPAELRPRRDGGSRRTRTSDLTLIRRAL
jgi:hypothetical protein